MGAPEDLVQIVHGYGEAGNARHRRHGQGCLCRVHRRRSGDDEAAADTLTPVVLELGGKDPFIVLDDASLSQCVPMALRGAFQSCGQNCAGAERFYVQEKIHDEFVEKVMLAANQLWRLGPRPGRGLRRDVHAHQAAYVQASSTTPSRGARRC